MPRRRLGQHFLADPSVVRRILEAAQVGPQDRVLEIGPGKGVLTRPLVEAAGRVVAVEVDPVLAEALPSHPRLEVVRGDILQVDLPALLAPHRDWKVVANLPYYITTPILERLLVEAAPWVERCWVMVQKEVADRMVARGTRESGALSHFIQYHARTKVLFKVPPGAFRPPPEVDSAVVFLEVHRAPPVDARKETLFQLVRASFQARRKTLRKSLSSLRPDAGAVLEKAGIDPTRRPETLTLEDFAALARAWEGP